MYSAVNGKRNVYHKNGQRARVTECTFEQIKEIHELMMLARKHRNRTLSNTIHNDDDHN